MPLFANQPCCPACNTAFPAGDLIGLVAETLEGLPVVTAFNQNKFFIATAANKIDEHHRALFNGESLNLWLAFYCDLYGAILVLAVCIFAVVMRDILGAAAVGLAFSNTIQVGTWCLLGLPSCLPTCSCHARMDAT
jgi:ABC-type multidrug transport system fused ATPase/permease subunit